MKHISFVKRNYLLLLGVMGILTTGCIKEELDACKNNKLTLKVENAGGQDITPLGDVRDASLYFFDEELNFLEKRNLDFDFITSRQEIELKNYPSDRKLHIVAWGNLGDEKNQTVTDAKTIEDLKLMLKSDNGVVSQTPDSLFYGKKDVITMDGGVAGLDTVVVRLKVGTFTIKTEGLENAQRVYGLKSTGEYNFGMTNTLDTYDYTGTQTGSIISYKPDSEADPRETKEWSTTGQMDKVATGKRLYGGRQNAFSGEKLSVSIDYNGQTLGTVSEAENTQTGEMEPINIVNSQRTDIILVFKKDGLLSAKIRVTPWGVVDDDIIL